MNTPYGLKIGDKAIIINTNTGKPIKEGIVTCIDDNGGVIVAGQHFTINKTPYNSYVQGIPIGSGIKLVEWSDDLSDILGKQNFVAATKDVLETAAKVEFSFEEASNIMALLQPILERLGNKNV